MTAPQMIKFPYDKRLDTLIQMGLLIVMEDKDGNAYFALTLPGADLLCDSLLPDGGLAQAEYKAAVKANWDAYEARKAKEGQ